MSHSFLLLQLLYLRKAVAVIIEGKVPISMLGLTSNYSIFLCFTGSPSPGAGGAQEPDLPDLQGERDEGRGTRRVHGVALECAAEQEMMTRPRDLSVISRRGWHTIGAKRH